MLIEHMPVSFAFIAMASLALSAAGLGTSLFGAFQEGAAQKAAEKMKADSLKIEAARERTRQIRAGRAARAQIIQQGANTGSGASSSVATGAAGAMAQAYGNIVGINQQESSAIGQSALRQDILNAKGIQTLGQGIGAVGALIGENQDELASIFGVGAGGEDKKGSK